MARTSGGHESLRSQANIPVVLVTLFVAFALGVRSRDEVVG